MLQEDWLENLFFDPLAVPAPTVDRSGQNPRLLLVSAIPLSAERWLMKYDDNEGLELMPDG